MNRYFRYFLSPFSFLLFLLPFACIAQSENENAAKFVVSHAAPLDVTNPRMGYELEVLQMALEHTRESHGDYHIETYPYSSRARIERELLDENNVNALHTFGYTSSKSLEEKLTFIRFPVFLGVLGYRVCFVSEQASKAFSQVKDILDLRQFTHGQGAGWTDSFVMKHNGLNVVEFDRVPRLIRMTASNQVQTFCRGISEIEDEYQQNKQLAGLTVDESIMLYYPHPRFFWTRKNNKVLIERMEVGLQRAFNNGKLRALFVDKHKKSLQFVSMPYRRVITLKNPMLDDLKFDYRPFVYMPASH